MYECFKKKGKGQSSRNVYSITLHWPPTFGTPLCKISDVNVIEMLINTHKRGALNSLSKCMQGLSRNI